MDQILIDNTLLGISLISAIIVTKCMSKRKTGPVFSTLLLFPPLLIFLNMWAHTVAVTVLYSRHLLAGGFQFNFTVYSHFLFGIIFISLSGIIIHQTKKYLSGYTGRKKTILLLNCLTFVLISPVGFINPIGFLPVLAVIFSSITIAVHNPYKGKRVSELRRNVIPNRRLDQLHQNV